MLTVRSRGLRAGLAVLAAATLFGGCNGGNEDEAPADDAKPEEVKDQTLDRKVTVRVQGARTFDFSGTKPVRFVTRRGSGSTLPASVASVTIPDAFASPDGSFVQPEVAVAGMYTGDGNYTIPAGNGTKPTTGPTVAADPNVKGRLSVGQVTFARKDPPNAIRFDYTLEPCQVRLADNATSGTARCPGLIAHTGERVSMELSWEKP